MTRILAINMSILSVMVPDLVHCYIMLSVGFGYQQNNIDCLTGLPLVVQPNVTVFVLYSIQTCALLSNKAVTVTIEKFKS